MAASDRNFEALALFSPLPNDALSSQSMWEANLVRVSSDALAAGSVFPERAIFGPVAEWAP